MDIYSEVTNRIMEQMEEGIIPWQKPWVACGKAISRTTGKPYSLLNQMLLGRPGEYLTFKQCQEAGGNGVYTLGDGEYLFETQWYGCGNNAIYARGTIGFDSNVTDFPEVEHLPSLDYSSHTRTIRAGQIVVFENLHHHFIGIKLGTVKSSSHGHPRDEMEFEYHIYSAI